MSIFSTISAAFRELTAPPEIRPVCVLPMPAPKLPKAEKPKNVSTVIDTAVVYNKDGKPVSGLFDFHTQSKEADRQGAVRYCTAYDKQELQNRGLWGFKKVQTQNEKAKTLWFSGETVAAAAKSMGLSESWTEKRYAAFGTALSIERGE